MLLLNINGKSDMGSTAVQSDATSSDRDQSHRF